LQKKKATSLKRGKEYFFPELWSLVPWPKDGKHENKEGATKSLVGKVSQMPPSWQGGENLEHWLGIP